MSIPEFSPIFTGSIAGVVFGGVFFALIVLACITDVRTRRIPNNLVAVLALAGIVFSVVRLSFFDGLVSAFGGLGLGLALWILFYAIGVLGAGDVKFFAAACAWLGPSLAWRAALVAAAFGGILAIVFLVRDSRLGNALHRLALLPLSRSIDVTTLQEMSQEEAKRQLPYGVALGAGVAVVAMFPAVLT